MWHAIQGIYRKIYFRFKTQNAYEAPDDFTKNLGKKDPEIVGCFIGATGAFFPVNRKRKLVFVSNLK